MKRVGFKAPSVWQFQKDQQGQKKLKGICFWFSEILATPAWIETEFLVFRNNFAFQNVSRKTLFNWESGVGSPSAEALSAWVAIGLDLLYMVTGQHADTKPLPPDEQMWLDCYRGWEVPLKRQELARALGLTPGQQVVQGAATEDEVGGHPAPLA